MSFKYGELANVEEDMRNFFEEINVGQYEQSVHMKVEHTDTINLITGDTVNTYHHEDGYYEATADTVYTNIDEKALYTKVADCMTAIVYAPLSQGKAIVGLIHAGWRGADAGVFMKSLTYLKDELNVNLQMVHLGFVPHLKVENLLLKSIDQLTRPDFHFAKGYLKKAGDVYHFDQTRCVVDECLTAGVNSDNIEFYDIDTYSEAEKGNTFSHRYYAINEQRVPELREGRFILAVRNSPTR